VFDYNIVVYTDTNGNRSILKKPTWGTCAGLILLAAEANAVSAKQGGQDLVGGLAVRVNRNHFGRQRESFEAQLDLPFLSPSSPISTTETSSTPTPPFPAVFIRAPIVESLLSEEVETLAVAHRNGEDDIVAVRQGHVFGTSFHPELAGDSRVHEWWLAGILEAMSTKAIADHGSANHGNI